MALPPKSSGALARQVRARVFDTPFACIPPAPEPKHDPNSDPIRCGGDAGRHRPG